MSDLPRGWARVSVGDLAADEPRAITDGPFGSNLKSEHYTDAGPRVIRLQNIGEGRFNDERAHISDVHFASLRQHEAKAGDVLVAMLGDKLPRACLVPPTLGPAIVKADCARVRVCSDFARPQFVSYALNSEPVRSGAAELIHGVGRPRLGLTLLRTVNLPIAPLGEQSRIVEAIESYSSRIDESIVLLARVQRNLKRYRASVLKAAVEGRLVPTEAELARVEKRDYEPASVLLERILVERRQQWEKEGRRGKYEEPEPPNTKSLPDLPEGWCWASVDQLGEVSGGLTKNAKRDTLPQRLPYLRVANVYANELRLNEVEEIGVADAEVSRTLLRPGDLLVVEGNGSLDQVGRVALWNGSISPCLHQNHLIKVRLGNIELASWVLSWLLSPAGRVQVQRVASSTSGLHTLSISKIAGLPVPLCPVTEQPRIRLEVDRLVTLAVSSQHTTVGAMQRASRLRQSILKWAFEGKLVDQDPNDEPASALMKRIRDEREPKPSPAPRRSAGRPRSPKKESHP